MQNWLNSGLLHIHPSVVNIMHTADTQLTVCT